MREHGRWFPCDDNKSFQILLSLICIRLEYLRFIVEAHDEMLITNAKSMIRFFIFSWNSGIYTQMVQRLNILFYCSLLLRIVNSCRVTVKIGNRIYDNVVQSFVIYGLETWEMPRRNRGRFNVAEVDLQR